MAKQKTAYVCDNCGQESSKWIGKCPSCGQWNTFKEIRLGTATRANLSFIGNASQGNSLQPAKALHLDEIEANAEQRIDMGDDELNRVLGGGLVVGSITLLGGEPGIGKSTLTLQTALQLSGKSILYVSGEESAEQLKMRAERLSSSLPDNVLVLCETQVENILAAIIELQPDIVIIDSIQTMTCEHAESSAGSITQIRESAAMLLKCAKQTHIPIILIGQDGSLAGPKILEHMVDTVIQFEGDRQHLYRVLRSIKNRFGSTSEIGLYEMQQSGLRPVANPSELLLSNNHKDLSGIAISSTVEGARTFLVEAQALVSTAAYGTPQRSATGFDQRRLNMLLAVLEKRVGFKLAQKDVFVNIAGGLRITDLSVDLAVIAAVLSSNVDTAIPSQWCMAGEVGLSGEVRQVARIAQRIAEAERLGFTDIIVPPLPRDVSQKQFSIKLHSVKRVEEALRLLFG